MKPRQAAFVSAAGTIAVFAGVTSLVLANATRLNGSVLVPGLLDIEFHHNRGISFGLFAQDGEMGSRLLIFLVCLLIAGLGVLAWKTSRTVIAIGLGMVIGGAVVNVLDRVMNGAVFDYLFVHLGTLPLFICNTPDVAISLGFLIWLAGEYLPDKRAKQA